MATRMVVLSLILAAFLFCNPSQAFPFGRGGAGYPGLFPEFYQFSCPQTNEIVMSVLERAIAQDPRMAASLLRLHFHDCFVQVPVHSWSLHGLTKKLSLGHETSKT